MQEIFQEGNREEILIDVMNPSLFLEGRFGVDSTGQNLGSQRIKPEVYSVQERKEIMKNLLKYVEISISN